MMVVVRQHLQGFIRVSGHLPLVPIKNGTTDIPHVEEQMRYSQPTQAEYALAKDPDHVVHRGLLSVIRSCPILIALLMCLVTWWCNLLTYCLQRGRVCPLTIELCSPVSSGFAPLRRTRLEWS